LFILAFFGYDKIENIEITIMNQANERLTQTDSILSKIDQSRIDSLNQILLLKEQEYNVIISNFERIVQQSMDLQSKLLESLSENERTDMDTDRYVSESPTDIFTIYPFIKELTKNRPESIYLVFKDGVEFSKDDYLSVSLFPKGRRILILDKRYKISSKFNKMSFGINPFEDYKDYELEIAYFKKENHGYKKSYIVEKVKLLP
jgi:hypothetical protein